MKLLLTVILTASTLVASAQENEKAAKARKDMKEAQADLREAKIDSAADFKKFREEGERAILSNQTKITSLKAKKITDDKNASKKYQQELAALQQKNEALRTRLAGSGNTKTSKWSAFKREFQRDMDELGKAFKDIGVDNRQ